MIVFLQLTTAGSDTGPFDLYSNLDGYIIAFETGVNKATLETGYSTTVPDYTNTVRITSTGDCINSVDITLRLAECDLDGYVENITTTTTSTTTICIPQTIYAGETYYKSGDTAIESGLRVNNYTSFYPDGTKAFFTQHNNGLAGGSPTGIHDPIIAYDLATPWDVSTIIKTGELQSTNSPYQWFSTPAVTSNLQTSYGVGENQTIGHTFSEDGTKLFTAGKDIGLLQRYDLTTAWDITTMVFNSSTVEYTGTTGTSLLAVKFSSDGLTMVLLGDITARYDLINPWDIIGATLNSTATGNSSDINFQNSGLYLFTFSGSNLIRKTLGSAYDITNVIATQSLVTTVIPQSNFPRIVFKDGFKGYINTYNGTEPSIISAFELTCEFDISGAIPAPTTTTTTTEIFCYQYTASNYDCVTCSSLGTNTGFTNGELLTVGKWYLYTNTLTSETYKILIDTYVGTTLGLPNSTVLDINKKNTCVEVICP